MAKRPSLGRLIKFQELLLNFRAIDRTLAIPGQLDRQENDVEHSYFLAMMGWFLAPAFPHLDRDKIIRIALVHDLVELHAGDTFAYGKKTDKLSKKDREATSLKRLSQEWPDFPELFSALEGYEARDSEEAKFVYALDKILPPLMNILADGHGWRRHGIGYADFRAEKTAKVALSPEVYEYYEQLCEYLEKHPRLFPA
jgi:putative hydrolase of HD superfamily